MKILIVLSSLVLLLSGTRANSFGQIGGGLKTGRAKFNTQKDVTIVGNTVRFGVDSGGQSLMAFGAFFEHTEYDVNATDYGLRSFNSTSVNLYLGLQFPVGILKPYTRFGYIPVSYYQGSGRVNVDGVAKSLEIGYRGWGFFGTLGVNYSLIQSLALFFEADLCAESLRYSKVTVGSEDRSSYKSFNPAMKQVIAGIDLSL